MLFYMGTYGEDLQAAIVAQLQAERAVARLTYAELGNRAKIKEQTIMRYLTGKRDMPMTALLDICRALELEPRNLVVLAEERRNRK